MLSTKLARTWLASVWFGVLLTLGIVASGCAADSEEATDDDESALWRGPNRFGWNLQGARELDFGNAYWAARLSSMIYGNREELVRDLAAVGVNNVEVIFFQNSWTGTEAAYVGFGDAGFLAFRGTASIIDWLTDFNARRRDTRIGDVHTGFDNALLSIWNDSSSVKANGVAGQGLAKHLRRRHSRVSRDSQPKPLFVMGHSLGGALGTLASTYAHWDGCLQEKPASDPFWEARLNNLGLNAPCEDRNIEVTALYTFGAPRVGGVNHSHMSFFTDSPNAYRTSLFRFVHSNDLVTSVPDTGYIHPSVSRNERNGLIYLTKGGYVDVGGLSSEFLSWGWRTGILERIGDHGMANYATKLLRYAGQAAPPPLMSPARARNVRIKAAFLAPEEPQLQTVSGTALPSAELRLAFAAPVTNSGTRKAFVWRFENANVYVFEEAYRVAFADANRTITGYANGRSVQIFDANGTRLLSASGTAMNGETEILDVALTWYDWLDSTSSR
jgi:hypothetical protein